MLFSWLNKYQAKEMTMKIQLCAIRFIALVAMACITCPTVAEQEKNQYQELEWVALMPEDDLAALMNPPEYLSGIADGSQQDSVAAFSEQNLVDEKTRRFQQALTSTRVVNSYANKFIRLPGFIVPLESDETQKVTEFFIVPYFGACLHMPPPPPNQIIYSALEKGVELQNLYEPFWFEGKLVIETKENEMGTSAYRLKLDRVSPYEDE
jgi:hypothetical protein